MQASNNSGCCCCCCYITKCTQNTDITEITSGRHGVSIVQYDSSPDYKSIYASLNTLIEPIPQLKETRKEIVSKYRVPEFLSLRWNWVPPFLPPQASVSTPTLGSWGEPHQLEVQRDPIPTKGQTPQYSVLLYNPSNEEIIRVPAPSLKSPWTTHCSGAVGTMDRDVN